MKFETPLQQVWKLSGLRAVEFADLLGLSAPIVESYRLNTRPLRHIPELQKLTIHFGVEPLSLITPKGEKMCTPDQTPMTIFGHPFTADFCTLWKNCRGMSENEVGIALRQLTPVLEATLRLLAKRDPNTTRIFLQGLNLSLKEVVSQVGLERDLMRYFDHNEFVKPIKLEDYKRGADLRKQNDDLPLENTRWKDWVYQFNPDLPVEVTKTIRPTFVTPDNLAAQPNIPKEVKLQWETHGLGSVCTTRITYSVTQEKRTRTFENYEVDAVISGQLFLAVQSQKIEPKKQSTKPKKSFSKMTRKKSGKAAPIGRGVQRRRAS